MDKDQLIGMRQYNSWQLLKLYWQSEHRRYAYLSVVVITIMTIVMVLFDVAFSYWFNYFYDALQAYDAHSAVYLLVVFFILAGLYIVTAVYRYYISQLFGLRWRQWLTNQVMGRWLEKGDYYYLEQFDKRTDNPDQRIQEDVGGLVTATISLVIGFISAVTTVIGFVYVLWKLSGIIHIPLGPLGSLNIPGYLVWVAVLYALIGTYITFKIGYPLISLNFEQQRREASFRFAAIDLRVHAENVALYRGEKHQRNVLEKLFGGVLDNWYMIILRQKLLLWFTSGYNQVAVVLPLFVALPHYFAKVFKLGDVMQSMRAFSSIQEATSFFVNSYTSIAEWRAIARRLTSFLNHLEEVDELVSLKKHVVYANGPENKIVVSNLQIHTPDDKPLLGNINQEFVHGNSYLIKGDSGIGKSTFLRAIAGIWPFADGKIVLPDNKTLMFLPQKPYMPIGTLAEAILFPQQGHPELASQIENVMRECNLEQFIPRLQETATWSEQLSPGEQQRIAFARVLLHKPDWCFLDESTSMLDMKNEQRLYSMVKTKLPNCSLISVGHRPSLSEYHDHVVDMTGYSLLPAV